jgi:phosphate-selective porin OprO/OprP
MTSIVTLSMAAAFATAAAPALAQSSVERQLNELKAAIETQRSLLVEQQRQLEVQATEIERLKTQVAATSVPPPASAASVETQEAPRITLNASRPTITSADGNSSFSVRSLVQLDMADYNQAPEGSDATDFRRGSVGNDRETQAARDLSAGAYFRRARLGFEGRLAHDFNYRVMLELGGSGNEGPTRINDAWIAYRGFAQFQIQLGAFSPPANMDDATSSDGLFIERATPAEVSRSLGGADGRIGLGARGSGERWMSSLTLTTRTVNDDETFDSALALVGRVGVLAVSGSDFNIHTGASLTWVLEPADQGETSPIRFRDRPELRVDSTRLIDTGNINADAAYAGGLEFAANWKNWYLQAENFWYGIERPGSTGLSDVGFGGYYLEGSWILTGEARRYDGESATFLGPRPKKAFTSLGGRGAWELALRYSNMDLNDGAGLPGTAAASGSVRGGEQSIWTFGVNWYLNANMRLTFNYLHVDVDRLNPAGPDNPTPFGPPPATPPLGAQIGQDLDIFALRSQYSF